MRISLSNVGKWLFRPEWKNTAVKSVSMSWQLQWPYSDHTDQVFNALFYFLSTHRNFPNIAAGICTKPNTIKHIPCQLLRSPNTTQTTITYDLAVFFPPTQHILQRLVLVVVDDWCFFGAGRKRRMVRFWTHSAVQRPPLSSRAWALARSTRSNWRWWRTTSVVRLPPKTLSQVSVHMHAANRLIIPLF